MSNRKVEIFNPLQGLDHLGIVVKSIDEHGNTVSGPISAGSKLVATCRPGRGLVIECVDLTPQDPDAKILGDELVLRDGGA